MTILLIIVFIGWFFISIDNIFTCIKRLFNGEFNAWAWVITFTFFGLYFYLKEPELGGFGLWFSLTIGFMIGGSSWKYGW